MVLYDTKSGKQINAIALGQDKESIFQKFLIPFL